MTRGAAARATITAVAAALVGANPASGQTTSPSAPVSTFTAPLPPRTVTPADQAAQDARRHGPEIVAFAGVKRGDVVIDLVPGGGYWTRLFAQAVGPHGHVYGIFPAPMAAHHGKDVDAYKALAADPAYANVSGSVEPATIVAAPAKADLVFTSQNYHDYADPFMGPVDPAVLAKAVFDALKPGGVFLVIDHAAAKGSGLRDTNTLHRIDPATVKAQVLAAGFRFEGESRLLANPADDHTLKVFDPAIRGHTDQFVFKFRKPR
jgi:predicted methyltransferase